MFYLSRASFLSLAALPAPSRFFVFRQQQRIFYPKIIFKKEKNSIRDNDQQTINQLGIQGKVVQILQDIQNCVSDTHTHMHCDLTFIKYLTHLCTGVHVSQNHLYQDFPHKRIFATPNPSYLFSISSQP